MNLYSVLIVEDEKEICDGIEIYLKNQGYNVFKAGNGVENLEIIERENLHLAIVDIMMPKMDGITMVMKLREKYEFPVIMLTAKSEEMDKIMGLNIGADDYVTKPFNPMELLARVNSQLRRYSKYLRVINNLEEKENNFTIGGLELNIDTKEVTLDGEEVKASHYHLEVKKNSLNLVVFDN